VVQRRLITRTVGLIGAAWVVLCGILMLVGAAVKHSSRINSLDRRITNFVVAHRTPALNQLMKIVTWSGSWLVTLGMAVLLGILVWRRRLPAAAVIAVLAGWWGELLAVTVTKRVVMRPRPPESVWLVKAHGWSFPSGHTANATVVFATAAAVATVFVQRRPWRSLIWALAVLATALVGFSRIELGVHWTTDVLASAIWTVAWLVVLAKTLQVTARSPAGAIRQA
jgi:membrane-associated phospholipid phosphatase